MLVWLVGEDFDASASPIWPDRSGHGANASCASLTCPMNGTINGHRDVLFPGGGNGFALTDQAMAFKSQSWTFYIVAKPSASAGSYGQLLGFYASNNYVKFQRDATSANIAFQVIPGVPTNYLLTGASWGWAGNWERLYGSVDSSGAAKLGTYNTTSQISSLINGSIGAPTNVDFSTAYLGTNPTNPGETASAFIGEIAEVIVFDTQISQASQQAIHSYLTARYGF